ncbi:unnamed protein product [Urochloa humidicola]
MSDGSGDQRDDGHGDAWWDRLGGDMTALILSKLPLRSMLRASAVCTAWRAAALRATSTPRHGRPWLFLHGRSNGSGAGRRNAFAFDPDEPSSWVSFTLPPDFIAGAGGYAFAAPSPSHLAFAPLLRDVSGGGAVWRHAPPLASHRYNNPVVAAVAAPGSGDGGERLLLLVAGGGGFPGGLVDIGDRLPTELYECDEPHAAAAVGAWEQCAPLPDELAGAASTSSSSISSALVGGRFLFACGVHSCAVSLKAWAPPRKLCPPPPVVLGQALVAAFVATARRGRRLVVAGVVAEEEGRRRAVEVWDVEPDTLAARRIGEMPAEMAAAVLPPHGCGGVRCVGQDGVIYVVSEEEHGGYPACACEVIGGGDGDDGEDEELACRWSRLPPLPAAAGRSGFRRMAAFCSPVLLRNHLHAD